jgi:hypothetical protein
MRHTLRIGMRERCKLGRLGRGVVVACVCWLALVMTGCGRVGVRLLLPRDAGPVIDVDSGPCVGSSCEPPMCEDPGSSPTEGACGCGIDDRSDSDGDGVPDCVDFCPGVPDQRDATQCACAASDADADQDGVHNCLDRCPFDNMKAGPGLCGCGVSDADDDGDNIPNCQDECPHDPDKTEPGKCGCGQSDQDTDLDGTPDCMDRCSGREGATYTADDTCGTGYCHAHNMPSTCMQGVENVCLPAQPLTATDATCDNIDDDCDGSVDEDFPAADDDCGMGVCASKGHVSCEAGEVVDTCKVGKPVGADDATCDGRDDDCDGKIDENFAVTMHACMPGACVANGTMACVQGVQVDGCMMKAQQTPTDATCDNIDDDCDGMIDDDFMTAATSCGVGVCARTGMRTCTSGSVVDSCKAGTRTSATDTVCNGLDDDCDGKIDDEFVVSATACGTGACASTGMRTCSAGKVNDSCVPKKAATSVDDATVPGNNIDDDCDGAVDEDVPACDTTPRKYEAGAYLNITVPGNCHNLTVRLWGGGGASGENEGTASGGDGGPGGYATANVLVAGSISLYVGQGAASGCSNGGSNAGSATYNGGNGGSGDGADGADGAVSGGGSGGRPSSGARGGDGHFGGGGGGQGNGGLGASGNGGGGGAASVLIVNGVRAAVAGGGGGGGGAQSITILGTIAAAGGGGGSGCRGNGQVESGNGGGGGGGGMCQGSSTQGGSGVTPAFSSDIPSNRARGGSSSCAAGNAGYAILTFSP